MFSGALMARLIRCHFEFLLNNVRLLIAGQVFDLSLIFSQNSAI